MRDINPPSIRGTETIITIIFVMIVTTRYCLFLLACWICRVYCANFEGGVTTSYFSLAANIGTDSEISWANTGTLGPDPISYTSVSLSQGQQSKYLLLRAFTSYTPSIAPINNVVGFHTEGITATYLIDTQNALVASFAVYNGSTQVGTDPGSLNLLLSTGTNKMNVTIGTLGSTMGLTGTQPINMMINQTIGLGLSVKTNSNKGPSSVVVYVYTMYMIVNFNLDANISAISPTQSSSNSLKGGDLVYFYGSNLMKLSGSSNTMCQFGDIGVPGTHEVVKSGQNGAILYAISCTTPPQNSGGVYEASISLNGGGTWTNSLPFTYFGLLSFSFSYQFVLAPCPGAIGNTFCTGQGTCLPNGTCICNPGYTGPDCSSCM